jgi:predicted enzyme related to lactoylglutathione lyase
MQKPKSGSVAWIDLTVENAEQVRDFYHKVAGWTAEAVDMGGYSDFNMKPEEGSDPVAGICHARGSNAGLPSQWMIYIVVEDLDRAVKRAQELGGAVVRPAGEPGGMGRFAVVRDPAGAVAALYEVAKGEDG